MKQLLLLIKKGTERCAMEACHSYSPGHCWTVWGGGCPDPRVTPSSAHAERLCSTLGTGQCSSLGLVSNQVAFLIVREKKPVLTRQPGALEPMLTWYPGAMGLDIYLFIVCWLVGLGGQGFSVYPGYPGIHKLSLDSQISTCFCLPTAGIKTSPPPPSYVSFWNFQVSQDSQPFYKSLTRNLDSRRFQIGMEPITMKPKPVTPFYPLNSTFSFWLPLLSFCPALLTNRSHDGCLEDTPQVVTYQLRTDTTSLLPIAWRSQS